MKVGKPNRKIGARSSGSEGGSVMNRKASLYRITQTWVWTAWTQDERLSTAICV